MILPENCLEWNSRNDGDRKIKIDLIISEATLSMLDNRNKVLKIEEWRVIDVEFQDRSTLSRMLGVTELLEVQSLNIQL